MLTNKKLNCGIRIVMERIPYVQSVAVGIWVRAGAVDETAKISGISHYIEHMLFKGTEKRSAKQIAEDIDKIGGQINAFTGKEATCYYVKTLASNLDKACDVLTDMFLNSKFDEDEMKKEKRVIYEEMKMIEDSPEDDAHDIISEVVFHGIPLSKSIIGTPDSLKGITQEDIKQYMKKEYARDSIVVSVAGNFDEQQVCDLFEGKLKSLTESKEKKEPLIFNYEPGFRVKVKEIEQSHLCLGTKGISLDDDHYYTMAILSNIMGGGMSSRLFQNIREEKGLAYSVYSMSSSYSSTGYFNIYAGVSHDKVEDAIGGIGEELKNLEKNGITPDELNMAKEQLKAHYIFSQENVNSRMFANGKNTLILNRIFTPEEIIESVDAITMEDMQETIEMISNINRYCGVLVGGRDVDIRKAIEAC